MMLRDGLVPELEPTHHRGNGGAACEIEFC
jgi:hypothetical protein